MKKIAYAAAAFLALACQKQITTQETQDLNDFEFLEATVEDLQNGYKNGSLRVATVVEAYTKRIAAIDHSGPSLMSVIVVNPEAAAIADSLDLVAPENRGPLHGIPVLLKDNIDTHDQMATTAGSRALAGSMPLEDSFVAQKLRAAGAVILGKANLSEWANFRGQMSSSGWSGVNGQTRNPYVLTRTPCGSSSGSGVAVSANLTLLAIGTETNGSIVCPSTVNGIVGIKPTVGLISRSGIIPISYTQDTAGPMARTVADAAIALGALTGVDSKDAKTLASEGNALTDYTPFLKADGLQGKRIGWFKAAFGNHATTDSLTLKAIKTLKAQGATIVEIEQINERSTGSHSFQVMLHEYKQGLNDYFGSLGPNAKIKNLEELIAFNKQDSIELKYYNQAYLEMALEKEGLDSKTYLNHLSALQKASQEQGIDKVMSDHQLDGFVAPTGSPAWSIDWLNGDNYHVSSSSPAAWAGYPNISVPMGDVHGLPVGLSFFGKAWSEPTLIEMAYSFEQATKARIVPSFRAWDQVE
jgi:amidase